MRSRSASSWLLLGGLATALSACPDEPEPVDAGQVRAPLAHLEEKKGAVTLERDGKSLRAELGYVHLGDVLETGPDGQARVRFPGGRVVEIGPLARFRVGEDDSGIVLRIDRGLVVSRAPSGDGQGQLLALSIETPFGLTRLGSARTEVSLDVKETDARLEVMLGAVEFINKNGQATTAAAGESLAISLGQIQLAKKEPEPITLAPIQVMVHPSGRVELKRRLTRQWRAVPGKGAPVESGDALRVRTGRSAMRPEGSSTELLVARGAELVFDGSARSSDEEQLRLSLSKGEVVANLAANRKSRLVVSGLELSSESGGQVRLSRTRDGLEVVAATGEHRLSQNGVERPLSSGQLARVGKSGVAVSELEREEVALPSRLGLKVHHPGLEQVALVWEKGKGPFQVQVATDEKLEQRVLSGVVRQSWVNVPAPSRGALYWRIVGADGALVDQGSASFAPEPQQKDLATLRNEVPDGREKTTIFFQDKPPAVTFTFEPEEGAAKYRVVVYRAGELTRPLVERTVTEESLRLEPGVLSEGKYVWNVTPLSESGEELRGGKFNPLELVYDNAVPTLLIHSPRNGQVMTASTVEVSGVAPVGAKVFVNGRAVTLDEKARFQTTATPFGRPPVVMFRMLHPNGSEVLTIRLLRRGK